VIGRVHVNHQPGDDHKVAVRFGDQLVDAAVHGAAWVDRPVGASSYHLWRTEKFGVNYAAKPEAMDSADPDHDGIVNRLEFLIAGRDPNLAETGPQLVPLGGADAGWFEFAVTRNPSALPDVARIQVSRDLHSWAYPSAGDAGVMVVEDSPNRHAIRIATGSPHGFVRVTGN
jgi:hypothetical protein